MALSIFMAAPIAGPSPLLHRSDSELLQLAETNRIVAGEHHENGPHRNLQLSPHFYSVSGQFGWVKLQGVPDCRSGSPAESRGGYDASTVRDNSHSSWRTDRKRPAPKFTTITTFVLRFSPVWLCQSSWRPRLPVRRPFCIAPILSCYNWPRQTG